MNLMQTTIPIQFLEFDFVSMYFKPQELYRPALVEEWFNEGVMLSNPLASLGPGGGPLMQVEEWSDRSECKNRLSSYEEDFILVQVIQMMPLRLNGYDSAALVLHEMVVQVWSCSPYWSEYRPTDLKYKAERRKDEQFFLILDRWLSWSMVHSFKRGHIGLVFSREIFELLLANSKKLFSNLQEEVEWGLVANLGQTVQQISHNLHEFHRARSLVTRVMDVVDLAFIRIKGESSQQCLQGVQVLVSSDLDQVKPPPMNTPFDEED